MGVFILQSKYFTSLLASLAGDIKNIKKHSVLTAKLLSIFLTFLCADMVNKKTRRFFMRGIGQKSKLEIEQLLLCIKSAAGVIVVCVAPWCSWYFL